MVSRLIQDLQESFNLAQWTEEYSSQINVGTTEMTVFWKSEKHETELWLRMVMSEVLKISVYKPTTSGKTFNTHIMEQEISLIQALVDIQSQSKISLETAMKF
jgi:hypothetical protein